MDTNVARSTLTPDRQDFAALYERGADSEVSSKFALELLAGEFASPASSSSENSCPITSLYVSFVDPEVVAMGGSCVFKLSVPSSRVEGQSL